MHFHGINSTQNFFLTLLQYLKKDSKNLLHKKYFVFLNSNYLSLYFDITEKMLIKILKIF
jgi:hypothetical protein